MWRERCECRSATPHAPIVGSQKLRPARVELPNPELLLIHDMYVDADIDTGSPEAVLKLR